MPPTSPLPAQHLIPVAVFMLAVVVLFWWVVIRPANRRAREHMDLVRSLRAGDRVVTAGGIHGTITAVRDRTVDIQVAQGVVLTLDKYAVRRRLEDDG